jgi:putative membrane protein
MWLHIKLVLVLLLYVYHIYLGVLLHRFKKDENKHSGKFYRMLNEIPSVLLIVIVILAVVQPLF